MRLVKIVFMLFILCIMLGKSSLSVDWSTIGQNPQGTRNISPEISITEALELKWKYTLPRPCRVVASPVVSDGIVFFAAGNGMVYAFDFYASLSSGSPQLLWSYKTKSNSIDSTPGIYNGRVIVAGAAGDISCLDLEDGSLLWQIEFARTQILSSPLIVDDVVMIGLGSPKCGLAGLDVKTGQTLWFLSTSQPVQTSPAYYGNIVYFGDNEGKFYGFDLASMSYVFQFDRDAQCLTASPAIYGGGVFFALSGHATLGSNEDPISMFKLDATDGTVLFQTLLPGPEEQSKSSSISAGGGRVYYVGGYQPQKVLAVDATTGVIDYTYDIGDAPPEIFVPAPAICDNRVFVAGATAKKLFVFDLSLNLVQEISLDGNIFSSPVVANSCVLVCTNNGSLYVFGSSTNTPPSPPTSFSPSGGVNVVQNPPTISWNEGSDGEDSASALCYEIVVSYYDKVLKNWVVRATTGVGQTSYTLPEPLANNTHVYYRVRTIDSCGAYSKWSSLQDFFMNISAWEPPLPPTDFYGLPGDSKVDLYWVESPSVDVAGYRLWVNETATGIQVGYYELPIVDSYTVSGLTNGIEYTFTLKAYDYDGQESDPAVCKATPTPLIMVNGVGFLTLESAVSSAFPGDVIQLGPGLFVVSETLYIREGVILRGYSPLHTRISGPGLSPIISFYNMPEDIEGEISMVAITDGEVGLDTGGTKLLIKNCVFAKNGTGVKVSPLSEVRIINNTIAQNLSNGIEIENAKMELRNNIIVQNTGFGVFNVSGEISGCYNDLNSNGAGNWYVVIEQEGNIDEPVEFEDVDNYDYREISGSATIDAGHPKDEYKNEPQPNGGRINMGAFGNTIWAVKSPPVMVQKGGKGGPCFIATAAGLVFEGNLDRFYGFRDEYLQTNLPGSDFVKLYYKISPPLADFIKDRPVLKGFAGKILEIFK